MSKLSVARLTRELLDAAHILRNSANHPLASSDIVSGILLLKWASDQRGPLQVPDRARWRHIVQNGDGTLGELLNEALHTLLWSNPDVLGGTLEDVDFNKKMGNYELQRLVHHFDRLSLSKDNLEFNDVVGRAYDRLMGEFADAAGKKGGVFYTPRSVIDLMVRLVRPGEGQSIYDPFAGSGGMLLGAREYVSEHSGEQARLTVFGQEINRSTWSIARLNLLFHGIVDASVLCGDTLTDPGHMIVSGHRKFFDRVLTSPPFGLRYAEREVGASELMRYGWSKKSDLMNVQYVLAMLSADGVGAVVTPAGVLFRGGMETEIRRGIVNDGRLAAVIGTGPNVFHGTAIPACILILRGRDGLPGEQRGTVLFINAESEVVTGRSRNYIEPRHAEKIIDVFRGWKTVEGFSRVVTLDEIAANDFNLSIQRYVEAPPPFEHSLDPRAALLGGVPRSEVEAHRERFQAFNIDPIELFQSRDPEYLDFLPEGYQATTDHISELAAFSEQELIDHCRNWWREASAEIARLAGTNNLLKSRSRLLTWFSDWLLPRKILDRYQLAGVFADWWADRHEDLKSLDCDNPRDDVLAVLSHDLESRVTKLVAAERQALVTTYLSWGERYAVSLVDLEKQRDSAARRLNSRLAQIGYPLPDIRH